MLLPFLPFLPGLECILVLEDTFPLAFRPFLVGVNNEGGSNKSEHSLNVGEKGESMSISTISLSKLLALKRIRRCLVSSFNPSNIIQRYLELKLG